MKKHINFMRATIAIFLFIMPFYSGFGQTPSPSPHKHMLWKITSPNGEINYLSGSLHHMSPSIYPLDQVFRQTFMNADQLVFEINLDSMKVKAPRLIREYATLPKGTMLKKEVTPDIYTLMKRQLDSLGLPIARFQHFNPVYVSFTINNLKLKKAGISFNSGIDKYFFEKAKKAGKQCLGLETPAFQLKLLFGNSDSEIARKLVKRNLYKADQTIKNFDQMMSAWKNGNTTQIVSITLRKTKKIEKDLYKALVVKRNKKWMPQIKKFFNNGVTTWVIVGVGHMIGSNGLMNLLKKAGYKVVQL